MEHFSTPMMKQYHEIKNNYPDCLLFYRMGDFYELFLEDAQLGAQILNITLTAKHGGKDGKIPMAGVPYHAVDAYIAKLVHAGYKVAICEQLSPPNKKGIVKRDVVRIVTPGTVLDEHALEKKDNNFIVSVIIDNERYAIAVADLSTGYFAVLEEDSDTLSESIINELSRIRPSECIIPESLYNQPEILQLLRIEKKCNIYPYIGFVATQTDAKKILQDHFGVKVVTAYGLDEKILGQQVAASLLCYLKETQKGNIHHIKKISQLSKEDGLVLDRSSMLNLELFSTIREHDTRGSLLTIMDKTVSAMGGRLLKQWMKKPLTEKNSIEARFDSVSIFTTHSETRDIIRSTIKEIPDVERILSRLAVGIGNARELNNLKVSLIRMLKVKTILQNLIAHQTNTELLCEQEKSISEKLQITADHIATTIVDEPPISLRDGGIIREGVHKELDSLRMRVGRSKNWIVAYEKQERERTKITSLKVRFNKVFGFYIEISKSYLHLVPPTYMRKQTLVNGERFITKELKEHEEIILTADEKINELEYQLFTDILQTILKEITLIQEAATAIAVIDCLSTFSTISESYRYIRPKLLYSGEIRIKEGRHPVVERLLLDTQFVPNDTTLDNITQSLLLITGPNMAGKSVFIRQVAIIVLMAQMGCFVPASSAHLSIVDRIFVRSGASDVITSGLSTFMVEMVETAQILHSATENSLIIMDEIGRGTSTYDGISIAWAVAEYLVTNYSKSPKVLFATHYHELQSLEVKYPKRIKNFHMAVTEKNGSPIFLHTILPGGASHSFGVAVAKLAGVPQEVIDNAYEMLQTLEFRDVTEKGKSHQESGIILNDSPLKNQEENQLSFIHSVSDHMISKEIEKIDIAHLTPLEALNILARIKEKLSLLSSSSSFNDID